MRRIWLMGLSVLALTGCFGARTAPTPTAAPTAPPAPTTVPETRPPLPTAVLVPLVTPSLAVVTIERVVVINTGGEGVNLRAEPSRSAASLTIVLEGDELDIVGPDREQDGLTWRNVRDRLGNVGWVAASFLGPPGSPSIVRPAVTAPPKPAAAKPTAPAAAKPTAPAAAKPTGPAAAKPTAPGAETSGSPAAAKPTVAAKPTQPAATKPQATPAGSGGLAVSANVARPIVAAGSQGLHVRVTQGGQPLAGARVVAVVQDGAATRTLDLGTTDGQGIATRSFDVGAPQGTVTINVTVTTADGRSATAAASFSSS